MNGPARGGSYLRNPAVGTETFSWLHDFRTGALRTRGTAIPLMPLGDVFATVAIMVIAFLAEVAFFVLLGIF